MGVSVFYVCFCVSTHISFWPRYLLCLCMWMTKWSLIPPPCLLFCFQLLHHKYFFLCFTSVWICSCCLGLFAVGYVCQGGKKINFKWLCDTKAEFIFDARRAVLQHRSWFVVLSPAGITTATLNVFTFFYALRDTEQQGCAHTCRTELTAR